MRDLSHLIKAYDIRGVVPGELNTEIARDVGQAFVELMQAEAIVVAHDMRESSPELVQAFIDGVTERGCNVVHAGMGSTDYLYFVSGMLDLPGAMFTASHNPAEYNGIKLCRAGAKPIGEGSGLEKIREWLEQETIPSSMGDRPQGSISERPMLEDYAAHMRKLVDLSQARPLKIVVDAGNGMAGHTVPIVFKDLPFEVMPMYFELDGSFPNHEANPIEPANIVDLQKKVLEVNADIGLAFDGDADRCFFVDEQGQAVSPSAIIGLIASRELKKDPGSAIVHNVITSQAVPEIIAEQGGKPIRSKVGHSYMKALMAEHNAIFGGEHSGHYYFRDFWRADTGMLAAMHVLAALAEQDQPLSQLMAQYSRYNNSGEINIRTADIPTKLARVQAHFSTQEGIEVDKLDGLTVKLPGKKWFNIRASNTEPLLRVNVEAPEVPDVEALTKEVTSLI